MDSEWTTLSEHRTPLVDKVGAAAFEPPKPPAGYLTPTDVAAPLMLLTNEICDSFELIVRSMHEGFSGQESTQHTDRLVQKIEFFKRLNDMLVSVRREGAGLPTETESSFRGLLAGLLNQRLELSDGFHADMLRICGAFVREVSETVHRQESDLCEKVRSMDSACHEWVSKQRDKHRGSEARLREKERALQEIWKELVSVASGKHTQIDKARPMLLDSGPSLSSRIEQGLYVLEGGAADCLAAGNTESQLADKRVRDLEGGITLTCKQLSELQSQALQMFGNGSGIDPRARVHSMRKIERDMSQLRGQLRGLLHRRNARRDALIRTLGTEPAGSQAQEPEDIRKTIQHLLKAATRIRTAKRDAEVKRMEIEQLACSEVGARALEGFETLSEWLRGYSSGLGRITLKHLREIRDQTIEHQEILHRDIKYVLSQMEDEPVEDLYDGFSQSLCSSQEKHVREMVRLLMSSLELIDSQQVCSATA